MGSEICVDGSLYFVYIVYVAFIIISYFLLSNQNLQVALLANSICQCVCWLQYVPQLSFRGLSSFTIIPYFKTACSDLKIKDRL